MHLIQNAVPLLPGEAGGRDGPESLLPIPCALLTPPDSIVIT